MAAATRRQALPTRGARHAAGPSAGAAGHVSALGAEVSRSRRRFLGHIVAGAAGVAAGACGPAQGAPPAPPPSSLSGKIHLYVRPSQAELMGQTEVLFPTFKRVAPNVEVVHDVFAASNADESYSSKLLTMFAAGTPPDVWGFGQNYMGFWARGMVADLTPLITRDKVDLTQFHTGLPEKFRVKGRYYGLPQLTTFGTLLFYNKPLFESAGLPFPTTDWDDRSWTLEAMVDLARKLTKNPGQPDAVYGLAYGPHAVMHAWLFGGNLFLPEHWTEGIAPHTLLDSNEAIEGHQFAQDLRWTYHVAPQPGVDPTDGVTFQNGRYAMVLDGGWNFWSYTLIKDFKWGAAAIPWRATNKNVNYNDFWELSSQSTNRDAAWAFIKHVTSAEVQREYSRLTGTPPTQKSAMDVWYQRYDGLMTRTELERVTRGAIEPKRSEEDPGHVFIEWTKLSRFYSAEVNTPLQNKAGAAKELLTRARPAYDAIAREIYDTWKGRTPS
jgi:multiple sugar transport system substrate-binding protein